MKVYTPEDARNTICPLMSSITPTKCVADLCHFWVPLLKIGKYYKEIDITINKLISYDLVEKECISCGACRMMLSGECQRTHKIKSSDR